MIAEEQEIPILNALRLPIANDAVQSSDHNSAVGSTAKAVMSESQRVCSRTTELDVSSATVVAEQASMPKSTNRRASSGR